MTVAAPHQQKQVVREWLPFAIEIQCLIGEKLNLAIYQKILHSCPMPGNIIAQVAQGQAIKGPVACGFIVTHTKSAPIKDYYVNLLNEKLQSIPPS